MRSFIELSEALTTPRPSWEQHAEGWTSTETFGDQIIACDMIPLNNADTWSFDFTAKRTDPTGYNPVRLRPTGEAGSQSIVIIRYVIACLREFLDARQPDVVMFSGNAHPSLNKLYTAMAVMMRHEVEDIGYELQQGGGHFSLVKNEA